jgi:hypothetical protein
MPGSGEHRSSSVPGSVGRSLAAGFTMSRSKHQLRELVLERLDRLVVEDLLVARPGAQGALCPEQELVAPVLHFGHGEPRAAGRPQPPRSRP